MAMARTILSGALPVALGAAMMLSMESRSTGAQSQTIPCRDSGQELISPPEIVSANGILKGSIYLVAEQQRLPLLVDGTGNCVPQIVRNFRPKAPHNRLARTT
jgi:hypothetical protein